MIRVLLADDQGLLRAGFRMILRAEPDIEVVGEAADGHEAVALAKSLAPDVVLMDIRMPKLDGVEATRRIATATDPARCSCSRPSTSTNTCTRRCGPAPAASCSKTCPRIN